MTMCRIARITAFLFFLLMLADLAAAERAVGPDFLLIQPHARTAAMGNAFTGVADDASALIFNAAGIPKIEKNTISFTHFSSFADTNYESVMAVFPQAPWGFGGAVLYDYTMDFTAIDTAGQETGQVNNFDFVISLSAGYELFRGFSAGISAKYFRSVLMDYSKDGFAMDAGVLWRVMEHPDVYIGVALQNLGTQSAYEEERDDLPLIMKAGVGVKHKVNDLIKFTAAADIGRILVNKYTPDVGAGVELCFNNAYFINVGFGLKQEGDTISVGGGFMPLETLRISYAFQPFENLGATHRISLDLYY